MTASTVAPAWRIQPRESKASRPRANKVFNENNSYLNGTSLGKAYHGIYGRSESDAQSQDPAGHAVQGLSVGVLNQAPRILGCNIVVTKYCHIP